MSVKLVCYSVTSAYISRSRPTSWDTLGAGPPFLPYLGRDTRLVRYRGCVRQNEFRTLEDAEVANSRFLPEDTKIGAVSNPFVCAKCGEVKLPRQKCLLCAVRPKIESKSSADSNVPIKASLLKQSEPEPALLTATARDKKGNYRYRSNRARRLRRARQIRLCAELLQKIRNCFERDLRGQLTLYEDRLPELCPLLAAVEKLAPGILHELNQNNPRKRGKRFGEECQGSEA
jgi:hypothetical protein